MNHPPPNFIRSARKKVGLSQQALASAVGVAISSVSNWELGVNAPRMSLVHDLASALGLSVEQVKRGIADLSFDLLNKRGAA